jgi:iron-sulfur cluster insertion protein
MKLEVTQEAFARVNILLAQHNNQNIALRISVDGGGCSGFMYKYEFVDIIESDDYIAENDGIKIIVDPISQEYLSGSIVDFIEELGSSYFKIHNPRATAKCGCGNSFTI